MDPIFSQVERLADGARNQRAALDSLRRTMWNAMPAKVISYNPEANTITARIQIRDFWRKLDLTYEWKQIPDCLDVPVLFPRGGGLCLTFPIQAGDECLLVFASRCIDAWWETGQLSNEGEFRANELSDAFAIMGTWSKPNVPSGISTSNAQLRTEDGTTYVEVTPSGVVNVNAQHINLSNGGTLQKLVTEAFVSFFNAHNHGGSAPTVPMSAAQLTTVVKAE